jgi:spermidine/putrescine-binding protein
MKFITPQDKTFISIENVALPIGAPHEEHVYTFLNFLYQPHNLSKTCNVFGVFPATLSSIELLKNKKEFLEIQEEIQRKDYQLHFFQHQMPEENLRRLWIEIKS